MDYLTVEHVLRMGLELCLGVCIKLLCDNGRVHWRDLINDLKVWVPGAQPLPGDGLGRQAAALAMSMPSAPQDDNIDFPTALAAK